MEVVGDLRDDVAMKRVMLDLLHLNELHISIPPFRNVFLIEQSGLLDWDYFVCQTVHYHYLAFHIPDVVDVRKMIVFELHVHCVLIVEHAAQGPDRALQNAGSHFVLGSRHHGGVGAEAEAPEDDPFEGLVEPGEDHLEVPTNDLLPYLLLPRLSVTSIIENHILGSEFLGQPSYKAKRVPHVGRVPVRVHDHGQSLHRVGKHRRQPDNRHAVVVTLHDVGGCCVKGWGSVLFVFVEYGRSAIDAADGVG